MPDLDWTPTPPKVERPTWYYWRRDPDCVHQPVRVSANDSVLLARGMDVIRTTTTELGGEWCGPLPTPPLPDVAALRAEIAMLRGIVDRKTAAWQGAEEFRPCPFCGSRLVGAVDSIGVVECGVCGASGPCLCDIDQCTERWNTREPPLPDVGQLRNELDAARAEVAALRIRPACSDPERLERIREDNKYWIIRSRMLAPDIEDINWLLAELDRLTGGAPCSSDPIRIGPPYPGDDALAPPLTPATWVRFGTLKPGDHFFWVETDRNVLYVKSVSPGFATLPGDIKGRFFNGDDLVRIAPATRPGGEG